MNNIRVVYLFLVVIKANVYAPTVVDNIRLLKKLKQKYCMRNVLRVTKLVHSLAVTLTCAPDVITEPVWRSGLLPVFAIFAGAGAGPRVGIMIKHWSGSEIFKFCRGRIIAFTKLKFALTG